jgi:hypothetical protein
MASTLLPEFIRANSDWLQRRVGRENGASVAAQEEFAPVCFLLAEALEVLWRTTQADLRKGMSGHRLREQCRERLNVADEVFALVTGIAGLPGQPESATVALSEAVHKAAVVREDFQKLLDWATAPPPSIAREQLEAAESGPFVRLENLETLRRPHGS